MRKQGKTFDKTLFALACGLTLTGFIAIADASAPQAQATFSDSFYFVKQQIAWGVVGFVALLLSANFHYSFWKKLAWPLFAVSLVFLVAVLLPSLSSRILGARRWLSLGPVRFQPSELVKFTLIIFIGRLASQEKPLLHLLIPVVLVAGLIMAQPDLGTTIVILAASFSQIFMAGYSLLPLAGAGVLGAIASFVLILISDYRRERLMSFLRQSSDPLGSSYHIRQILLALGSGGIFGVGLGQSRQKYLFLPEAATDSVFAIIAEELGFVGASLIIIVFAVFIFKAIKIVARAPDNFSQVLGAGIVVWIGGQVFLNIGSMTALIPLTGIPLPFFSYGGSSLTTLLLSVGILLNISKHSIISTKTKRTRKRRRR